MGGGRVCKAAGNVLFHLEMFVSVKLNGLFTLQGIHKTLIQEAMEEMDTSIKLSAMLSKTADRMMLLCYTYEV